MIGAARSGGWDPLPELLAVLLGTGFLHAFFRTVEHQWPASYHALSSGPGYAISVSPLRYLLFRFGPVLITVLACTTSLARTGNAVVLPAMAVAVFHAAATSGRALARMSRKQFRARPAVAVMHGGVVAGIMLCAVAVTAVSDDLVDLAPTPAEMASTMWTGLIAAVVGAYLVRITQRSNYGDWELMARSRSSIPDSLWAAVDELAEDHAADATLIRAVMLIENMQRPQWFRRCERLWGRLGGTATYGIMQVRADAPLSDLDSLRVAVETRFADLEVDRTDYGWVDGDWLARFAAQYNGEPSYAELLNSAIHWLAQHGG